MRQVTKPLAAAIAVLLALSAVAGGCGGDDSDDSRANGTDAAFVAAMIPHHEGAIEMAQLARTRAEHAEVRRLAGAIIAAQQAEIEVMRRVGEDLEGMGIGEDDLGVPEHMRGMDSDLHGLRDADSFDRAFVQMMVPHHEGAVRMAQVELRDGKHEALRRMARDIVDSQRREIRLMERWDESWYGGAQGDASMGHGG